MVELIIPTESKSTKLKRDVKKLLGLRRKAIAELKASGQWKGSPKARLLALTEWYQAQNNCGHCEKYPETSFSTRVHRATEERGITAGTSEFLRLWRARTNGQLV